MIIDADTHISKDAGQFTLEAHLEDMQAAGIDKSLCWLSPHHYSDAAGLETGNRYIAEGVKRYPDKIIGFGWADPTFGLEAAKTAAARAVGDYGLKGVKMNGAQNDYYIDDPELGLPLAEYIASLGVMLAFHIGPDAYEKTHPYRAARIARMFPETPILMVHMGMTDTQMNQAVLDTALQCPNMYLIGSATTDVLVLKAVKTLGAHRVMFGSDRPFRKMTVMKSMYELGLAGEITGEELRLVMGGNAERLFQ